MKHVRVIICFGLLAGVGVATAQELRSNPKQGEALYQRHCLRCHGEAGNGMGPEAKYLVVPPANFHLGKHRIKTNIELFNAIQDGVLFSPMHAWRGKLSDHEIQSLISYIRMFAPFILIS